MQLTDAELKHIENCQFSHWYKLFRQDTPRARILQAPEEFRDYLLADGIQLPSNAEAASDTESVESETVPHSDTESDSDAEVPSHTVPDAFQKQIADTIADLDNAVCPKLNWSAPKDSVWILPTNDMKCLNANDIYMLIKASDYCTHDLTQALGDGKGPMDLTLILREWFDLHPSLEFRCFIKDKKLVGVTQRDMNYYDFLDALRPQIEPLIQEFCHKLEDKFPDPSFVADIYVPRPYNRVWLIDINPFIDRTDSLLFSWDELKSPEHKYEFRLKDKADATRGFGSVEHTTNYVPHDLVDMNKESVEELVDKLRETYMSQQNEAQQA